MERGEESSTMELAGRAEEGIKAGGPDKLEQESEEKYLTVRGQLNYAKGADSPMCNSIREKGGKKQNCN